MVVIGGTHLLSDDRECEAILSLDVQRLAEDLQDIRLGLAFLDDLVHGSVACQVLRQAYRGVAVTIDMSRQECANEEARLATNGVLSRT